MKAGRIEISAELILRWLQLNEGTIKAVSFDGKIITLTIEHPEMPEWKDGYSPETVTLAMRQYIDGEGHRVSIREKITS